MRLRRQRECEWIFWLGRVAEHWGAAERRAAWRPPGSPCPPGVQRSGSEVHNVMSMLYYTLIVAFLIGTQAAPKSEDNAPLEYPAEHSLLDAHRSNRHHIPEAAPRTPHGHAAWSRREAINITVDPKIFRKRRFRSPRVLFSTEPPPVAGQGQSLGFLGGAGSLNRTARTKRSTHPVLHRGEFSVCDSVSMWVGDKTTATDIKGKEVTVLGEVNINNNVFKQYFFETKCRDPKPVSGGCRGIDAKHWNSYCTTTHTFVKALTMEGKQAAWRFIRIDTACVCVLSRKSGRP
ncbi:beta-nerve growth factor isoform X1 [Corapipo altera]|uniref:beta-nerve growth factor isoform X1 n=2 Tax=Pipridae TaxID=114313 RepID=UPI000FD68C2D|nr:beta-nerve growth factor isoform X1 [Corapipo altera]